MKKRILIIGGYGNAGRQIAGLLLRQSPDLQITLAGRNLDKAVQESRRMNQKLKTDHVSATRLDASDQKALMEAFKEVDLIINAASTIDQTASVVKAVLGSGKDYIDIQMSSPAKLKILNQHVRQFEERDICYVTDGGFHPGLPAALVRFCAEQMDHIESGHVYGALKINWAETGASRETMIEFIDELKNYNNSVYEKGEWIKQPYSRTFPFDFGQPFGKAKCVPMYLEEMKVLSQQLPELRDTGFFISGFNHFLDNWLMPIIFMGITVFPKKWCGPFFDLFLWGSKFTKPPYGVMLVSECTGLQNNQPVNIRIEISETDEYLLTAAPAAACVLQLIDGSTRRPGLFFQSNVVEPMRFLTDLNKMGVESVLIRNGQTVEVDYLNELF